MAEESPRLPDPQRELITPEGFTPAADAERRQSKQRAWFWLLLVTAALLGVILFLLPPAGFWSKLSAIGYSVCHQIPERSFFAHEHQFPLCARCTGMYLGALLSLVFHFRQGKLGSLPPRKVLIPLGLLFLAFALDGLNSSAASLGLGWKLYETTNLARLITGTGAGIVIGAVLAPIFNQTAWASWVRRSVLPDNKTLALLLAAGAMIVLVIYAGPQVLRYPAAVLSVLGVLVVLCLAYTTLALIILKRENIANSRRDLLMPLLVGMFTALLQVSFFAFLRIYFL